MHLHQSDKEVDHVVEPLTGPQKLILSDLKQDHMEEVFLAILDLVHNPWCDFLTIPMVRNWKSTNR